MQTIGRYQLQEKLGQGGMGIVYRAFDTLIERVVAIKVISSPADLTPEDVEICLRDFLDGRGGAWDWDDFTSIRITDPTLLQIGQVLRIPQ